ncbi:MAG: hypothetical protein M0P94_04510 [Candidatus Absconditabacterales bacterium]|nr:hypothetical protein [Candidatus Absconditabacterales bacterium]
MKEKKPRTKAEYIYQISKMSPDINLMILGRLDLKGLKRMYKLFLIKERRKKTEEKCG